MLNNLILRTFIWWRLLIVASIVVSTLYIPLQQHHLGGGQQTYLQNPIFWSMANFDGEHYLSIAAHGYKPLQYFFFPLYPILTGMLAIGDTPFGLALTAQLLSNAFLLIALVGLWKLVRLDYSKKIAQNTILLLLLFPTAFYFVGVYTESLFLALIVWSFIFARKRKWLYAILLAALASSTRIIGIVMLPVIFIEWLHTPQKERTKSTLLLLPISALGILTYLYFLYRETGDILAFKTSLEIVYGEQRSDSLVLLPQVLYRYVFKILPAMNWTYFEGSFSLLIEFLSGIVFFILSIYAFLKLRMSYAVFMLTGYILPTLSGSFSSMGRYVLVLFPGFIILALYYSRLPKVSKIITGIILTGMLVLATALFSRGYWIA
jgi:hypothetical protein